MFLNLLEKTVDGFFAIIPRDKPSMEVVKSARLIAHRGAHNHAQGIIENTLAAFNLAKKLNCWGIEFDVRTTADKVLVVNHDATLKRLWSHDRTIADLSFNELRTLAPDVPTLNEVVAAYGKSMHLLIELKAPFQDEDILVEALNGLSAGENYHLLTLDSAIFYSLSQFPKEALLLVASHCNVHQFCNASLNENYGGVLGHYFLINNKIVNRFKAAEKIVGVGMVDSKYSLYRELNRGVNWLFTNRADELNAYLRHF
ncbi:glycerophosphodiester phosphodiesterase family protein [Legionella anisa]|uniref:Glycerophosphodiester phosphodiesterase n=1 Tax=Legionella anisa TaxID=28082 RepID=A0AAX0WYR7_9GAMM|nr:glycerophosphodiester phosphodiesterase family protein [Legionella anisa]AWN72905.1 glycerophosphodiester phosphodiesterase [Legionella anisa]KTC70642.1 glycerophosphoryl diester phosphodiesterase [Legionella anisa]MBN5936499.1 glycerophosphodiester phosphodiesterase [Legionella anisa]MCW8423715.1 glycerophosphodiester phosphodiesterase family protein [Legionella anisa]MCW8447235.1 glycerophosphodiester phosphodiesterase family protein [Legionella anisa]